MKNIDGDLHIKDFTKPIILIKNQKFFQICYKTIEGKHFVSIECGLIKNHTKDNKNSEENLIIMSSKSESEKIINEKITIKRLKGYEFPDRIKKQEENKKKNGEKKIILPFLKDVCNLIDNFKSSNGHEVIEIYTKQKNLKTIKLNNFENKGDNEIIIQIDKNNFIIKIDNNFDANYKFLNEELCQICCYKLLAFFIVRGFKRVLIN